MKHNVITLNITDYYRTVLNILSFDKPFSLLRDREKDVFSQLLIYDEKYSSLPAREKSKLVFDKDVYTDIANKLSCSKDVVANVLSELRSKKILIKSEQGFEEINKSYKVPKMDRLSFDFKLK